ncbi:MAG: hypothetical protein ACM3NP_03275, partial [Actinomycetota bacterium]
GMAALPPVIRPVPGQENSGVKVLSQKAEGGKLKIVVSGRPDTNYRIEVFSPEKISDPEGARIISRTGMITAIELKTPVSYAVYVEKEIILCQQ